MADSKKKGIFQFQQTYEEECRKIEAATAVLGELDRALRFCDLIYLRNRGFVFARVTFKDKRYILFILSNMLKQEPHPGKASRLFLAEVILLEKRRKNYEKILQSFQPGLSDRGRSIIYTNHQNWRHSVGAGVLTDPPRQNGRGQADGDIGPYTNSLSVILTIAVNCSDLG